MPKHASTERAEWEFSPARRLWLYRTLLAALPLLIAYGAISADQAALWIALAGAILGLGTAAAHTPGSDSTE